MLIAVIGNIWEGIHLVGPYPSKEEAEQHLDPLVNHREDYRVIDIEPPARFSELVEFERSKQ